MVGKMPNRSPCAADQCRGKAIDEKGVVMGTPTHPRPHIPRIPRDHLALPRRGEYDEYEADPSSFHRAAPVRVPPPTPLYALRKTVGRIEPLSIVAIGP